ncbi:WbqC family protein [Patescibacteria group bacterium]|nr:WbqC family protein [Patescibacteria group bacterium]
MTNVILDQPQKILILQPMFIPWIGYFNMINLCDVFVILDTVQFSKQSWQQRNKIGSVRGPIWLTIPVKRNFGVLVKDAEINYSENWVHSHLRSIHLNYCRTKYFDEVYTLLEKHYLNSYQKVCDFTSNIIVDIASYLGITTEIIFASSLPTHKPLVPKDYLINICKHFGAKKYINGPAGRVLYTEQEFKDHDIDLIFHDYAHPTYSQAHGSFTPYLSTIDLLFNHGSDSLAIISQGSKNEI